MKIMSVGVTDSDGFAYKGPFDFRSSTFKLDVVKLI